MPIKGTNQWFLYQNRAKALAFSSQWPSEFRYDEHQAAYQLGSSVIHCLQPHLVCPAVTATL